MCDQLREQLRADVIHLPGGYQGQCCGLENIDAGTGQGRLGLGWLRFFLKGLDPAVGPSHHDTVVRHIGKRHVHGDQAGNRSLVLVFGQRGANVQVNQRVAAQHHGGLVKKATEILDAPQTTGRAHRARQYLAVVTHAFVGVTDLHTPAVTIAKVFLNFLVVPSHIHHDLGDAVAGQVLDQVLHHRLAQNRHHGLGQVTRERPHAGASPGCQNHAFTHKCLG